MPVGSNLAAPGSSTNGASMHARRSMPAEPGVACPGIGNSRPIRGSRMRTLIVRFIRGSSASYAACATAAKPGARVGGRDAAFTGAAARAVAGRQPLCDQGDEGPGHVDLGASRDIDFSTRPNHGNRIVVAVEGDSVPDLVGGDHVELLA